MGEAFNFKRALAGILSAGTAATGTCLASHYIENPSARLVFSAAFLAAYTCISTKLLSNERFEDAPKF
jgi:hypothetical protein